MFAVLEDLQKLVIECEGSTCFINKITMQSIANRIESRLSELENSVRNLLFDQSADAQTFSLVGLDGLSVSISTDLAMNTSEYFKTVLSTGMKENASKEIRFEHVDPKLLRIISCFIKLGPYCNEMVTIPKLTSSMAYQLMELCTQMFLPSACINIAERIEHFTELDASFLASACLQTETCGPAYRHAWTIVTEKAIKQVALKIERTSLEPKFSTLPIMVLEKVICSVENDIWPESYAEGPDGLGRGPTCNGFFLNLKENGDEIGAYVHISTDNQRAIQLCQHDSYKSGLYRFEIRAEPCLALTSKSCTLVRLCSEEKCSVLNSAWGFPNFFDKINTQNKYTHHLNPKKFKMSFKAAFSKLHRQCVGLLNYYINLDRPETARTDQAVDCPLLGTLKYFQKCSKSFKTFHANSKRFAEENLSSLLIHFVAKSFLCTAHCDSMLQLPSISVEAIVQHNSLYAGTTNQELLVLKFVVRRAMAHAANKAAVASSKSNSTEQPKLKCSARGLRLFGRLLEHVRFPYIPINSLAALSAEEKEFARQHPSFTDLVQEAILLQLASAAPRATPAQREETCPQSLASGAAMRAARREGYGDIPKLEARQIACLI